MILRETLIRPESDPFYVNRTTSDIIVAIYSMTTAMFFSLTELRLLAMNLIGGYSFFFYLFV